MAGVTLFVRTLDPQGLDFDKVPNFDKFCTTYKAEFDLLVSPKARYHRVVCDDKYCPITFFRLVHKLVHYLLDDELGADAIDAYDPYLFQDAKVLTAMQPYSWSVKSILHFTSLSSMLYEIMRCGEKREPYNNQYSIGFVTNYRKQLQRFRNSGDPEEVLMCIRVFDRFPIEGSIVKEKLPLPTS